MSEELLGILMLIILLGVIFIGYPISFTLIVVALAFGYFSLGDMAFNLMVSQTFGFMQSDVLAAVPLFIFMGYITEQAGLMERLFVAFRHILAPLRGSLYLVVILTSTIFAMATGIVGASVTVLGIMAGPTMIKCGYNPKLSAGAITAGGTLGIHSPQRNANRHGSHNECFRREALCCRFWARLLACRIIHYILFDSMLFKAGIGTPYASRGKD